MQKAKRILSVGLIVLMVCGVFGMSGCTSKAKTTTLTTKPVTLNLWTANDWKGVYDQTAAGANYGDFYKYAARFFTQEHKNVTINVQVVAGADRDAKFSVAIQSHTQPDIYIGASFVTFDYAHDGLLVPLNDVITAKDKADIPANIWSQVTANGNIYCYPYYTENGLMAINTDLVKQAGATSLIPAPDAAGIVKWTPDQFKALLQGVKSLKGVYPYGYFCGSTQGDTYNVMLLEMFGAKLFSSDGSKVAINSADGVKALQYLVDMKSAGLFAPGPESLNVLDTYQMFLNKKLAVSIFNNVNYDALNNGLKAGTIAAPFNIQLAYLPSTGAPMDYAYAMSSVVFKTNTDETNMAKQFVEFYTSEPYVDASLNMMPLKTSVANKITDPVKVAIADSAKYAVDFAQEAPGYNQLRAKLFPVLQAAMIGSKTPQQALDSYATTANQVLQTGAQNSVLIKKK
jgi:multiple sugar transport system substrate-binding protein